MNEDEQAKKLLKTKREIEELRKALRCLHARKNRYRDKLDYIAACMESYLSEDALESGALGTPDFRDWPSEDGLKELFRDMHDTSNRMTRAEHRLRQI